MWHAHTLLCSLFAVHWVARQPTVFRNCGQVRAHMPRCDVVPCLPPTLRQPRRLPPAWGSSKIHLVGEVVGAVPCPIRGSRIHRAKRRADGTAAASATAESAAAAPAPGRGGLPDDSCLRATGPGMWVASHAIPSTGVSGGRRDAPPCRVCARGVRSALSPRWGQGTLRLGRAGDTLRFQ